MIGAAQLAMAPGKFKPKRYITLPRYLCISPGSVVEDFENAADWTVNAGNTPTDDAVNFKTGTKSLYIDTTGAATCTFTKTVSFSLSSADTMELWILWSSAALYGTSGASENITLILSADAGITKYFQATINLAFPMYTSGNYIKTDVPWRLVRLGSADWTAVGGMTWADTVIRFRISCQMTGSRNHKYNFDSFRTGCRYHPAVLLTHDSGDTPYVDFDNYAMPEIGKRRIPVSYAIWEDSVTANTNVTRFRAFLKRYNVIFVNHSETHDWYTKTQADIETDIQDCADAMNSWGIGRYATDYIVNPAGEYKVNIKAACLAKGAKLSRGTYADTSGTSAVYSDAFMAFSEVANPAQSVMYLLARQWVSATTYAVAKGDIDKTINKQAVFMSYQHQIYPAGSWTPAAMTQLYDYVKQKRLLLLTMDDLYRLTLGPAKVGVYW